MTEPHVPRPAYNDMEGQATKLSYLDVESSYDGPPLILPKWGYFSMENAIEESTLEELEVVDLSFIENSLNEENDSRRIYTNAKFVQGAIMQRISSRALAVQQYRTRVGFSTIPSEDALASEKNAVFGHQFLGAVDGSPIQRLPGLIGVGLIPRLNCEHASEPDEFLGCGACLKKFVIEWHCFVSHHVQTTMAFLESAHIEGDDTLDNEYCRLLEGYGKEFSQEWLSCVSPVGGLLFITEAGKMMTALGIQPGGPWSRGELVLEDSENKEDCLDDFASFYRVLRILYAVEQAPWQSPEAKTRKLDMLSRTRVTENQVDERISEWLDGVDETGEATVPFSLDCFQGLEQIVASL